MNSTILLLSIVCLISLSSTLFDSADARIFLTGEDGGDCKSVGTWNSMSNTCTLTKDVTDFIFIGSLQGGFTLDGNYHTLKIEECLVTEDAISRMYWYGTALTIYTKDVTVKNLTIKGTENPNCTNDAEWDKSHGIISGLNTILYDNVIEGHDIGIMITDNDAQLIRDNIIRFNEKGISFRDGTFDTEIVDNTVYSNGIDVVIHSQNYDYVDVMNNDSQSNSQVITKPVIEKISPQSSTKSFDDIPFGIISGEPKNIQDKQTNKIIEQSISDNSKQSSLDTPWNTMLVLLVLSILGVGLFWVLILIYDLRLGGKIFLGLVIIWTFFWILILIGNIIGENDSWALGIVVYVFVGLPTTIGLWWLWVRISSRKNSKYTSEYIPTVTKSIPTHITNTSPILPKQTKVKQTKVKQTKVKQTKVKPVPQNKPLEILKERLVKGEITIDEFNNLKSELGL